MFGTWICKNSPTLHLHLLQPVQDTRKIVQTLTHATQPIQITIILLKQRDKLETHRQKTDLQKLDHQTVLHAHVQRIKHAQNLKPQIYRFRTGAVTEQRFNDIQHRA